MTPRMAQSQAPCNPEPSPVQPRDKALRICNEELIVQTVQFGTSRHGAIATGANLGTTVTYRLIDKLVASGSLMQAKDGTITIGENK